MENIENKTCENCIHFNRHYYKDEYLFIKTGFGFCRLKHAHSKNQITVFDGTCERFSSAEQPITNLQDTERVIKAIQKRLYEIYGVLEHLNPEKP